MKNNHSKIQRSIPRRLPPGLQQCLELQQSRRLLLRLDDVAHLLEVAELRAEDLFLQGVVLGHVFVNSLGVVHHTTEDGEQLGLVNNIAIETQPTQAARN